MFRVFRAISFIPSSYELNGRRTKKVIHRIFLIICSEFLILFISSLTYSKTTKIKILILLLILICWFAYGITSSTIIITLNKTCLTYHFILFMAPCTNWITGNAIRCSSLSIHFLWQTRSVLHLLFKSINSVPDFYPYRSSPSSPSNILTLECFISLESLNLANLSLDMVNPPHLGSNCSASTSRDFYAVA